MNWGKRIFVGKINLEYITFTASARNITFITSKVFRGRTNVPARLTMRSKGRTNSSRDMSHNSGTRWSNGSAIVVKLAKE